MQLIFEFINYKYYTCKQLLKNESCTLFGLRQSVEGGWKRREGNAGK